tara:strand:- start:6364 stop:6933 length:570 start_codon:yes stop_codon:yes gene_type:complete
MNDFISDQSYKGLDYTKNRLPKAEYENCVFEGCDFSNGYLDGQNFMECTFVDCNLSNTNLSHTTFNEVRFEGCKFLGVRFEECADFLLDFSFLESTLNLASFVGLSLKKQEFNKCKMIEVDFSGADLRAANFDNCDLARAIFKGTNLEKADFRTAINFSIDPENNRLKKAKFTKDGVMGLLDKYEIVVD